MSKIVTCAGCGQGRVHAKGLCPACYARERRADPAYNARRRERYATDPQYRERLRKQDRERSRERYATDPQYRERQRERQRELYYADPAALDRRRARSRERQRKYRAQIAAMRQLGLIE